MTPIDNLSHDHLLKEFIDFFYYHRKLIGTYAKKLWRSHFHEPGECKLAEDTVKLGHLNTDLRHEKFAILKIFWRSVLIDNLHKTVTNLGMIQRMSQKSLKISFNQSKT